MRSLFAYEPMISGRIDVAMMITAACGITISLLLDPFEFWFSDIWVGGALSMPVGLALGIIWEKARTGNGPFLLSRVAWPVVASIALCAVGIYLLFSVSVLKRRIADLRQLPEDSLARIEVYEPFQESHLRTIQDPDALSSFVRAVRLARIGHPGKSRKREPIRTKWFQLILTDGRHIWLSVRGGPPGIAFGMFIEVGRNRGSMAISNLGEFRSAGLAGWIRQHGLQK